MSYNLSRVKFCKGLNQISQYKTLTICEMSTLAGDEWFHIKPYLLP